MVASENRFLASLLMTKGESPLLIAALYDIHGNLPALEAVLLEIAREQVEQIVVGGDVLPGPMPRESMDRLQPCDTCEVHPGQWRSGGACPAARY